MDIFEFLLKAGPAVRIIMRLGFMPKEEDFVELTEEQYKKFMEAEGYTDEKVYALLPQDQKNYDALEPGFLTVCKESDIATLKRGWQIIEYHCKRSGKTFVSEKEKLAYAATLLPNVFS